MSEQNKWQDNLREFCRDGSIATNRNHPDNSNAPSIWRLTKELGAGFSSIVFRGESEGLVRAIKIFNPGIIGDQYESINMARIERQLALRGRTGRFLAGILGGGQGVLHPGEADADPQKSIPVHYLEVEYVPGTSLDNSRERFVRRPDRVQALIAQIAAAARQLEILGFTHRDIKPSNIILSYDGSGATLVDTGVIRRLVPLPKDKVDSQSDFYGTLRYCPPEQLDSERFPWDDVDAWCAVSTYQIAAIAYELATGYQLWGATPEHSLAEHIRNGLTKWLASNGNRDESRSIKDKSLASLVLKCMDVDPRKRPKNWDVFGCRREFRTPTIVMLYGGGTIGSDILAGSGPQARDVVPISDVSDPRLVAITERLHRDYQKAYGFPHRPAIDLVWDVVRPDTQQVLSENAAPDTWKAISESIKRVYDEHHLGNRNRYVLGVVLLHGTDTLAYTAAALLAGIRNLPFPIAITGSNDPLDQKAIREISIISGESDAWRNIIRSIHFLETFGHRTTEVYVVFGDRIHHAVNLRKYPALSEERRLTEQGNSESFTYANCAVGRNCAFRCIDGLYLNYLYPLAGDIEFRSVMDAPRSHYRHRRSLDPSTDDDEALHVYPFADTVAQVSASPTPCERLSAGRVQVVVVEGYASTTIPTRSDHPFAAFLATTRTDRLPVILIAPYGRHPDQTDYARHQVGGADLRVLQLNGLIKETAVPLLSVILGIINSTKTLRDGWKTGTLDKRYTILENAMTAYDANKNDLRSHLLGRLMNSTDQRKKFSRLHSREAEERVDIKTYFTARRASPAASADHALSEARGRVAADLRSARDTRIPQRLLYWLLGSVAQEYIDAKNGTKGFAFLYRLASEYVQHHLGQTASDGVLFCDASTDTRRQRIEDAKAAREAIDQDFQLSNMFSVTSSLELRDRFGHHLEGSSSDARLVELSDARVAELRVSCDLLDHKQRKDLLFALDYLGPREIAFFRLLAGGMPLGTDDHDRAQRSLRELFGSLSESQWHQKTTVLHWILLGAYRAAAVHIARILLLDEVARQSITEGVYLGAYWVMAQRIQTVCLPPRNQRFEFVLRYGAAGDDRWYVPFGQAPDPRTIEEI